MKNVTKVAGAIGIAAVIAAGSSAFTAGGLTLAGGQETRFIGGTVSQAVTGATLNTIDYAYHDVDHLAIDTITLVFADSLIESAPGVAAVRTVQVTTNNGTPGATFTCVTGTGTPTLEKTSICSAAAPLGFTGLTDLDVTVT